MPVDLETKRMPPAWTHRDVQPWSRSLAFAMNPRGMLAHRVRYINTYYREGKPHHYAITYWCGNSCCMSLGEEAAVLTDDPPKDRLLCVFCEARAQAAGGQAADKIAKRHVHRGALKAMQVCCKKP